MPVSINEFNEKGVIGTGRKTSVVRPKLEKYLAANAQTAYTVDELAATLNIQRPTCNQQCSKMAKEGVIARKKVDGKFHQAWIGYPSDYKGKKYAELSDDEETVDPVVDEEN